MFDRKQQNSVKQLSFFFSNYLLIKNIKKKWNTNRMSLFAAVKTFIHLQIGYVRKVSYFVNSLRKLMLTTKCCHSIDLQCNKVFSVVLG